jgi:predicted transposase/invertase (TIGR01784 family)
MERLNPLNDFLFMKAFGEKGNEEQLVAFLNAILKRTGRDNIVSVEILENKTLTADIINVKSSVLDVRAHTDKGDYVNIEVQLKDMHDMDKRSLFYWSKQYDKKMDAGDKYSDLPNVIAINIINFDFIPLDDFHTSFHLREDKHADCVLTDAIEIHFISMPRFRKLKTKDIKNNTLVRWLAYLDETTPPKIIEEVVGMDAIIQRANERYEFLAQDKETLRLYEMRQMGQMDWNNELHYATAEANRERDQERAARMQEHAARMQEHAARMQAERRIAELEAQLRAQ